MSAISSSAASYDERVKMPLSVVEIRAQIETKFEKDDRIGWPKNSLLSWPVSRKSIHDSTTETRSREVEKIMNNAGWSASVYFDFRYHNISSGCKTLVVRSLHAPHVDEWKTLLIKIRTYLHSCNEHCNIEMFQRDWFYQQPIRSHEHEILEAWEAQYRAFLEILLHEDFDSLRLVRMSTRSAEAAQLSKPRVVVCSRLVDSLQWDVIRTKLQTRLLPVFDLEFQYSNGIEYYLDYTRRETDVTSYAHDRYSATVKIGASIGISGGEGGGTAGAKLRLLRGNNEEDFVLTNNHVAKCEETELKVALTPNHSLVVEKRVQLVSPADADWIGHRDVALSEMIALARAIGSRISYPDSQLLEKEAEIKRQEGDLDEAGEEYRQQQEEALRISKQKLLEMKSGYMKGLMARIKDHDNKGEDMSLFGKDVARWCAELSKLKHDQDAIEEDGKPETRFLGYLWAASGRRVSHKDLSEGPGWVLDWALGKLNSQKRTISEQIPYFSQAMKSNPRRPLQLHPAAVADEYQNSIKNMPVVKHGRTTGWTTAVVNHAVVFIKSKGRSTSPVGLETVTNDTLETVKSDEIHDNYGDICRALEFFNNEDAVMEPGDSGSIVLANEESFIASWIGLAFAGSFDGKIGYMTPIDVVLQDIANVTGCLVTMPKQKE